MEFTPKQQEAIDSNGNILVSASAGSGKTAVLAERIVEKCLKENINIDKFVVMTFTKLAASEMKAKIIKNLESKRTTENEAFLDEQLVLIEKANICTLDSFNSSLVKDYFYVLGDYNIEPNFSIMESVDEDLLVNKVLDSVFDIHYNNDDEDFEKLLELYANYRGDEDLKDEIKLLYRYSSCMPYPEKTLQDLKDFYSGKIEVEKTTYYEFFKTYTLNILRSYKSVYDKLTDIEFVSKEDAVITKIIDTLENGTYDEVRASLPEKWATLSLPKDLDEDTDGYFRIIREKCKKFVNEKLQDRILRHPKEELEQWMNKMTPSMLKLIELAEEFSKKLLDEKCKENKFVFDDISHFAIKILTNEDGSHSKIADTLKEQFEFVIVDEYQDTNNLQETILKAISRSGEQSNMFMVGDVKQSIYGFRNAEPNIFTNKYNAFKESSDEYSKKIDLNTNFRSREEVLDSINFIFEKLMIKEIGGIEYDEDMALHYGGLYKEKLEDFDYTTEWLEVKKIDLKPEGFEEGEEESEEYQKQFEIITNEINKKKDELYSSFAIAKKIKELIDSGFKVYEDGKFRNVKYSDFAILTRSNASAVFYYEALKCKDIPCSLVCEGSVLTEYEIARVISLLKVLDNPYDNVAMITILYSEMFNFSPEELLEIKNAAKLSNWIDIMKSDKIPEALQEKANYFNSVIKELKEFSLKHSIEDLIKKIYEITNLEKYITGLSEMKSKSESMRVLLEYARKYEKYGTRNLFDFVSDVNLMIESGNDIDKFEEVETGNTVNVVTMHKSKGLEYSVVFLPSLNKSLKGRADTRSTRVDKDLGYISKFIDPNEFLKETNFYHAMMGIKKDMDNIAEEIRIFYVALTRAKEKLYLVGNSESEKYNSSLEIHDGKYAYSFVAGCQNYYDFVRPVLSAKNSENYIKQTLMDDYDIVIDNEKVTKSKVFDYICDVDVDAKPNEFNYKFAASKDLNQKVSVSEIKRRFMVDDLDDATDEEILNTKIKLSSEEVVKKIKRKDINTLAPNERGTLMHKLVKILDGDDVDKEFNKLIEDGIFTENELSQLNKDNIYKYFESEVFNDIKNSNFVKRELPFMMKKRACDVIKDETSEDEVIIQGIIDCVYEKDGKLIVLDYKTDRVHGYDSKEDRIEEIKKMYKIQLDIYAEAIQNIYDKKVDKKVLYLFDSGDTVEV